MPSSAPTDLELAVTVTSSLLKRLERLERWNATGSSRRSTSSERFEPCSFRFIFDGGNKILLWGASFLPDHYAPRIIDHNFAVLLNAPGANLDDAPLRLRFGLSLLQDFGFRIERTPSKSGLGNFISSQPRAKPFSLTSATPKPATIARGSARC